MSDAMVIDPPTGEKKRRRTETQTKIIEEAWKLINQSDETEETFTVRKLADKVGVTAGRILQYYDTIDSMLLDVFVFYYRPIFAEIEGKLDANPRIKTWRDRVKAATRLWVESYYQHRAITRRAMAFSWRFEPSVREQFKEFNELLFNSLNNSFDDPSRRLPKGELVIAARAWYRIMLQAVRLGFQKEESAEACVEEAWPMIELLLDGIDARRGNARS